MHQHEVSMGCSFHPYLLQEILEAVWRDSISAAMPDKILENICLIEISPCNLPLIGLRQKSTIADDELTMLIHHQLGYCKGAVE